jgi:hypothetical protein
LKSQYSRLSSQKIPPPILYNTEVHYLIHTTQPLIPTTKQILRDDDDDDDDFDDKKKFNYESA